MTNGTRKILLTPDERSVRSFLEAFVALAIASLDGHSPPGVLQMTESVQTTTISSRLAIVSTALTSSSA